MSACRRQIQFWQNDRNLQVSGTPGYLQEVAAILLTSQSQQYKMYSRAPLIRYLVEYTGQRTMPVIFIRGSIFKMVLSSKYDHFGSCSKMILSSKYDHFGSCSKMILFGR